MLAPLFFVGVKGILTVAKQIEKLTTHPSEKYKRLYLGHIVRMQEEIGTGGATREDVALFAKHVGPDVKIKAAGGIASLQDAEDFLKLGADRLGTSRIVKAVKELEAKGEL